MKLFSNCHNCAEVEETVLENSEFLGAGVLRLAGICCEDFSIGLMIVLNERLDLF